jgi:hypothetical protein
MPTPQVPEASDRQGLGLTTAVEALIDNETSAVAPSKKALHRRARGALWRQLKEAETQIEGAQRPAATAAGYRAAHLAIVRCRGSLTAGDPRRQSSLTDRLDRLAGTLSSAAELCQHGRTAEARRQVQADLS